MYISLYTANNLCNYKLQTIFIFHTRKWKYLLCCRLDKDDSFCAQVSALYLVQKYELHLQSRNEQPF